MVVTFPIVGLGSENLIMSLGESFIWNRAERATRYSYPSLLVGKEATCSSRSLAYGLYDASKRGYLGMTTGIHPLFPMQDESAIMP